MRRREFISLVGAMTAALPLVTRAQQTGMNRGHHADSEQPLARFRRVAIMARDDAETKPHIGTRSRHHWHGFLSWGFSFVNVSPRRFPPPWSAEVTLNRKVRRRLPLAIAAERPQPRLQPRRP